MYGIRFWPLPLAKKVQVTFGAAVLLVLTLALSIPYIWMGQLIKKDLLDTGRSRSKVILDRHFQLKEPSQTRPSLDSTGQVRDPNDAEISWFRFVEGDGNILIDLDKDVRDMIETLKEDPDRDENILLERNEDRIESNYVRIFRATGNCISCHNPQGSGGPFALNKLIGAVLIRSPNLAREINKTVFMNRIWIIVAGLIGGAGAIVVFYMITQRLILRPIRQLRALANNVAEGNLEIRSSIATRDEYEKLAKAFNHMLDALQAMQEKLRQVNKQLDAKIAELSGRNIELFKANKIKGEFLANISHEFRTPLNAILGFAQVLRDKPILLKKEKAMINDLLELAKTQAGKMELHIGEASVADLLESLLSQFSLLTKKKKIKVKLIVQPDLPLVVTDVGKVQQILYNFLSNAAKFTPARGRIEIEAQFPSPGARDTGPESAGHWARVANDANCRNRYRLRSCRA